MFLAVTISSWLFLAAAVLVAILCLWALIDCLRRPQANFAALGKLTKGAWSGILTAATLITVAGVFWSTGTSLLTLAAAVVAGVYLADVRPAVSGKGGYDWF